MVYNKEISGEYVKIRSIKETDAEFSMKIRQDKKKNKFLHFVDNDIEKQRIWIKNQRETTNDYFFIAQTIEEKYVGTVGIYDIVDKVGHLGRLLMIGNPFQTFEAMLLSMIFAYEILGLDELYGDVHVDNTASMNISEAFGFHFENPVYDKELDRWVRYGISYKSEFSDYRKSIEELIYRY